MNIFSRLYRWNRRRTVAKALRSAMESSLEIGCCTALYADGYAYDAFRLTFSNDAFRLIFSNDVITCFSFPRTGYPIWPYYWPVGIFCDQNQALPRIIALELVALMVEDGQFDNLLFS